MRNKYYIFIAFCMGLIILNSSCEDFLDVVPDSRTELDNDDKITKLLVSGYADHLHVMTTEMMSDNVDDRGSLLSSFALLQDQMYNWEDIKEVGNESPKRVWDTHYMSIATANQVLKTIEEMGKPERLNPQRGEALMIRAYHHFILVNMFAHHYTQERGETDLGITYMESPETTVNPKYVRESVAEVYRKIDKDIEEALPLIDDNLYQAPKYHFNRKASFAFAARFNLYYGKYDKVIEYANEVLGSKPENMVRDVKKYASFTQEYGPIATDYIRPENTANLMLIPAYSRMGNVFGNYSTGKKYMHSRYLSSTETMQAPGPWGNYVSGMFYLPPLSYTSGYIAVPRVPYIFEYTDKIAGNGFIRSIYIAFSTDETLLCRAEAYIMQENYAQATKDLQLWMSNQTTSSVVMTEELIDEFYGEMEYYRWDDPTPKKRLNPENPLVSTKQENFLHCLLHFRRIETLASGLRWFDVKRFGIVIYRRLLDNNFEPALLDELPVDDPRRAIQLPSDVISAGLTPNPREK